MGHPVCTVADTDPWMFYNDGHATYPNKVRLKFHYTNPLKWSEVTGFNAFRWTIPTFRGGSPGGEVGSDAVTLTGSGHTVGTHDFNNSPDFISTKDTCIIDTVNDTVTVEISKATEILDYWENNLKEVSRIRLHIQTILTDGTTAWQSIYYNIPSIAMLYTIKATTPMDVYPLNSSISPSAIVRANESTLVTVTAAAHGLSNGDSIKLVSTTQPTLDATVPITYVNSGSFTYNSSAETPISLSVAGGTMTGTTISIRKNIRSTLRVVAASNSPWQQAGLWPVNTSTMNVAIKKGTTALTLENAGAPNFQAYTTAWVDGTTISPTSEREYRAADNSTLSWLSSYTYASTFKRGNFSLDAGRYQVESSAIKQMASDKPMLQIYKVASKPYAGKIALGGLVTVADITNDEMMNGTDWELMSRKYVVGAGGIVASAGFTLSTYTVAHRWGPFAFLRIHFTSNNEIAADNVGELTGAPVSICTIPAAIRPRWNWQPLGHTKGAKAVYGFVGTDGVVNAQRVAVNVEDTSPFYGLRAANSYTLTGIIFLGG